MSVDQRELSKVKIIDRYKDIVIDHVDDNHVRIMKLFPLCHETENPIDIAGYRRFHVRFYLPEHVFKDKRNKSSKCFIMLNGLDERFNFNLYDQIGKGLARAGYSSVLLPLPNHLNRNIGYRSGDLDNIEQPSDSFLTEPKKIIDGYNQVIGEIDILIHHIQQRCEYSNKNECCSFFKQYFHKNTQVSILGYSLGGLVALSYFLLRNDAINSCIMLNSGAKLSEIDVSQFIEKEKWKGMIKSLNDNRHTYENSDERMLFENVFLGHDVVSIQESLAKHSRKVLFILGGADSVTRRKGIMSLEPDDHGLATLQLPGIHHFISSDIHWDQWFPIVLQTITLFDISASKEILSANDIIDTLIDYQIRFGIIKGFVEIDKNTVVKQIDRDKLERTLLAAKCIYGSLDKLLIEVYKLYNKYIRKTDLYPSYYGKFYTSLCKDTPKEEIARKLNTYIELLTNAEQTN